MPTKSEIEAEFENFKQLVIKTAKEWPSGCSEGKEAFLTQLGLPSGVSWRVTINVKMPSSFQDDDGDMVSDPEDLIGYAFDVYVGNRCTNANPDIEWSMEKMVRNK